MADRKVRTDAGEQRFKTPVGSVINIDGTPDRTSRPITATRLLSVKSQLDAAKAAGDDAQAKALTTVFLNALRQFSKGRTPDEVIGLLRASSPKAP